MQCPCILVISLAGLVSCAEPVPVNQRAEAPNPGPDITGWRDLIAPGELQVALATARGRFATLAPWSPIFRLIVVSRSRLEAFYCPNYEDRYVLSGDIFFFEQNKPRVGYLVLERSPTGWHIVSGHDTKALNDSHIIVTG
jgi:hypothetical protein